MTNSPMTNECPMPNVQWTSGTRLDIGHWSFIGHWTLVIGHSPMNFLSELREGLLIAWDSLRANKLRSALTTLGIVIGIVTVTLMARRWRA